MSFVSRAFAFAHRHTTRVFGAQTSRLWWPATEAANKAGQYTLDIEYSAAPVSGKGKGIAGILSIPDDDLIIHVSRDLFPDAWLPRPMVSLCKIGETAAAGRKYQVVTVQESVDYLDHYRITLKRH